MDINAKRELAQAYLRTVAIHEASYDKPRINIGCRGKRQPSSLRGQRPGSAGLRNGRKRLQRLCRLGHTKRRIGAALGNSCPPHSVSFRSRPHNPELPV